MSARYHRAGLIGVLALLLAVATGCGHRPPAPVEERSLAQPKHRVEVNGSYRVVPGDTLHGIAFSYGLDAAQLAKWNGISSPFTIYPDQLIRLTPPDPKRSATDGNPANVQVTAIKPPAATSTRAATAADETRRPRNPPVSKPTPAVAATDPRSWIWPADGRVLRGFVAGDPARKGLDIAGRQGQPVIASAGGTVVYSGSGLIGYGELIIIKHSERMLSAYAHNRVRLVAEGAMVTAGQKIAEMGANDQNEAILHFEIRSNGSPVNPLKYLPKK